MQREANESRARTAPKSAATKKKAAGSDFSSARGSEERHSSLPVTGRGSKRGRDTEIEKVGDSYFFLPSSPSGCPELDLDDTTDFGGSEADYEYCTCSFCEPEIIIACYDGTGEVPPPRRSGRVPKPSTKLSSTSPPPAKKRKTVKKATIAAADGNAIASKPEIIGKDANSAVGDIPAADRSTAALKPAVVKKGSPAVSDVPPAKGTPNSSLATSIEKEIGSAVSDIPAPEGNLLSSEATMTDKEISSAADDPPAERTASTSPPTSIEQDPSSAEDEHPPAEGKANTSPPASIDQDPSSATNDIPTEEENARARSSSSSTLSPPPTEEISAPSPPLKRPSTSRKGPKPAAKRKAKVSKTKAPRKVRAPPPKPLKTIEDVLANPPPKEKYMKPELPGVPQINPRQKKEASPSVAETRIADEFGLGAPSHQPRVYLPEYNRYRDENVRNYFYAGIPEDMPKRPKRRMGAPRVSKERARWMRFYNAERAKDTPVEEIEEKFAAILASEEEATASSSSQDPSTSTPPQSSQDSTTILNHDSASQAGPIPSSQESTTTLNDDSTDQTAPKPAAVTGQDSPSSSGSNRSQPSKKRKASEIEDPQTQSGEPSEPKDPKEPEIPQESKEPKDQATQTQDPQAPPPKRARSTRTVKKPAHTEEPLQEENFTSRPAVRLPISDHLKALLVDDWENVTKNLSLVPLPSEHPVTEILAHYYEEEKLKRRAGSAEADLLQEIVAGIKEYFNQSLGRILLYRFEREQYFEVRKLWDEGTGGKEWEGKGPADAYGAEHLSRLFGLFSSFFPLSLISPSALPLKQKRCPAYTRSI